VQPVIGGRMNFWSPNFFNVTGLVEALQALPNLDDEKTSDGYSLIPVHAWSHNVSDVVEVVKMLEEDGRFDVVLPSKLVKRVNEYFVR